MKNSIQHFTEIGIPKLEEFQKKFMEDPTQLGQFAGSVKALLLELGCHILSETLEECNALLEESLKRRFGWQIRDRAQKSLVTSLGTVTFVRTRFRSKETGKHAYLLDQLMGLTPHQRLSPDAKAAILEEAVQGSYQKAGRRLEEPVSRETAMRVVHSAEFPKEEYGREEKRKAERLYIEADEAHIALQYHKEKGDVKRWKGHKDNGKIVKLAAVHEGTGGEGEGCRGVHYFSGLYPGEANKELWNEVMRYLKERYDLEAAVEVRFHGDGGGWMKRGIEQSGGVFVLDGYHLGKWIRKACRAAGKEGGGRAGPGVDPGGEEKGIQEMAERSGERVGRKEGKRTGRGREVPKEELGGGKGEAQRGGVEPGERNRGAGKPCTGGADEQPPHGMERKGSGTDVAPEGILEERRKDAGAGGEKREEGRCRKRGRGRRKVSECARTVELGEKNSEEEWEIHGAVKGKCKQADREESVFSGSDRRNLLKQKKNGGSLPLCFHK